MDERDLEREGRGRRRKFVAGLLALGLGLTLAGLGFALAPSRSADAATQVGVLAGIGVGLAIGGAIIAWKTRPNDHRWHSETVAARRERLQAGRTQQLWLLPLASAAFLFQGTRGVTAILSGDGSWPDGISALLPVLYAWVAAAVAMGWDHRSRTERRFMEDELTLVLRARAVGLAFLVLMAGGTVALGLGLWRPSLAILALPFVLTAAGATAGIRFAWLDREAGRDG
ncbi:hypothetical protein [Brevundimonas sp. LM2]|uniref:hypothetical protein n=1 Tax=Brevundimonas sp. LM2 TaxID=1938605 RepID=UPI00123778A5|nr:hypothetical protein [Brevundimonas sp. LM2]